MVIYDRETGSLWSSVRHEAIKGRLKGKKLEKFPVTYTTWGAWKALHPNTKVLSLRGVQSPGRDRYASYHRTDKKGVRPVGNGSSKMAAKTNVVGLRDGSAKLAIPAILLLPRQVIQLTIGTKSVVVTRLRTTGQVRVFLAEIAGRSVRLPTIATEDMIARDTVTHSDLDLTTGAFVSGRLKGKSLAPFDFTQLYWFVWADYYPDTEIYRRAPPPELRKRR